MRTSHIFVIKNRFDVREQQQQQKAKQNIN